MKVIKLLPAVVAGMAILTACSSDSPDIIPDDNNTPITVTDTPSPMYRIPLSTEQKEQLGVINDFAFKMWNVISEEQGTNTNLSFAPLSMYQVFSMSTNGADNETLSQMLDLLGDGRYTIEEINAFNAYMLRELPKVDTSVKCNILNAGWMFSPLKPLPTFASALTDNYNAPLFSFLTKLMLKRLSTHGVVKIQAV